MKNDTVREIETDKWRNDQRMKKRDEEK